MTEHTLQIQNLSVGYDETTIIEDLNLEIPAHKVSVIIGSNGCGKSTLMKTLSRLLKPGKGQVVLDGKAVHSYPSTQLAQMLGLLPQSPTVPEGITVADLVARGRYPYRKFMQNMTKEDYAAVEDALERMGITELANRCVDELSGGQRQRVWIALALAQETDILLLDEPTTYLDIAYQVEILDLLTDHQREIVYLHFIEEMPYEEIAVMLDMKIQTVRGQVFKAMEKLRKLDSKDYFLFFLILYLHGVSVFK
mgnify:CR=1 FL=1